MHGGATNPVTLMVMVIVVIVDVLVAPHWLATEQEMGTDDSVLLPRVLISSHLTRSLPNTQH